MRMRWLNPQSYSLPTLISVGLHVLVIGLLLWQWPEQPLKVAEPVPQHITANIVQVESAAEKQRKAEIERQRKQKELAAKREAEKQKELAAQKKREQEQAKKIAEQKKLDQEKALKEKTLAEKQAKEKAALEAKTKAEQQKKAEQQRVQEEATMEKLMLEQAAAEQKRQEEAKKQAERAAALEASFIEKIRAQVSSNWRFPSVVRADQEVTVRINMVPTGQVMQVTIVKSSGNAALDRSVEQAIYRASPLPVPDDIRVFEKTFRNLTFRFRPENASW